eukprot:TRINITY_DN3464_c3_g1_i1.p1 TRINITY_DN3464_c3_g1~~TRINITY_DN3464_c3_g1_i1.p1  ORF type:complete len:629 (+),score=142.36 TRINITY_DN3464_c3_g1_i1:160-1887(+)
MADEYMFTTEEDVMMGDHDAAMTSDGEDEHGGGTGDETLSGEGLVADLVIPGRTGSTGGWHRLTPAQRRGVCWMWKQRMLLLRRPHAGGVVADGAAAAPVLTYLDAALQSAHGELALVVTEPRHVAKWWAEARDRVPRLAVTKLTSDDPATLRPSILDSFVARGPGVLFSTHSMLTRCPQLRQIEWSYLFVDAADFLKRRGQKLSETARALHDVPCRMRVALASSPDSRADAWELLCFIDRSIFGGLADAESFRRFERTVKSGLKAPATDQRHVDALKLDAQFADMCAPFITGCSRQEYADAHSECAPTPPPGILTDLCANTPPRSTTSSSDRLDSLCRRVSSIRVCDEAAAVADATPRSSDSSGSWLHATAAFTPQPMRGGYGRSASGGGRTLSLPTPPAPCRLHAASSFSAGCGSPAPAHLGRPPLHGRSNSCSTSLEPSRVCAQRLFGSTGSSNSAAAAPLVQADRRTLATPSPDHWRGVPTPQAPARQHQWAQFSSAGPSMSPVALTYSHGRGASLPRSSYTAPAGSPLPVCSVYQEGTPAPPPGGYGGYAGLTPVPVPLTPGGTPSPPFF